jgi:predicted DNA-binding transcriptional regulator AlpA
MKQLAETTSKQVSQIGEMPVYLTDLDLAAMTGKSQSSFRRYRLVGGGPKYTRIGRNIRYAKSDVIAWLNRCPTFETNGTEA